MTTLLSITTSYPLDSEDGSAPFIRSINQELAAMGFDVVVMLPDHPALAWQETDEGIELSTYRFLPRRLERLAVWGYGRSLESDHRMRIATLAIAPLAIIAALVATLREVKRCSVAFLHAHWLLPNGLVAAIVGLIRKVPFAISVHGSDVYLVERSPLLQSMARWIATRSVSVTVCSRDLKARLMRIGIDSEKMTVVPYGVDTTFFAPGSPESNADWRRALGIPEKAFVIGAVGRLVAKKGFDTLIRALGHLPGDVHVAIAGDGSDREGLEDLARHLGVIDRVNFIGSASRKGVLALYGSVDVVAVPSVVDSSGNVDGLPNVLLEALSCGAFVIASDVAGIPDVIEHRTNGVLVAPGAPSELASAVGTARRDAALYGEIKANARSFAVDELRWERVVARSPYSRDLLAIRDRHQTRGT